MGRPHDIVELEEVVRLHAQLHQLFKKPRENVAAIVDPPQKHGLADDDRARFPQRPHRAGELGRHFPGMVDMDDEPQGAMSLYRLSVALEALREDNGDPGAYPYHALYALSSGASPARTPAPRAGASTGLLPRQ